MGRSILGLLAGLCVGAMPLRAHRLDELLQSTLVAIEPDAIRVELHLNPGVSLVDPWIAVLDGDRDGMISKDEAITYAHQLGTDVTVQLDGRELLKEPILSGLPELGDLRAGWGILHIEFRVRCGRIGSGAHHLTLANHHWTNRSVYLVNAVKPVSTRVQITGQFRDETQRNADIAFTVDPEPGRRWSILASVGIIGLGLSAWVFRVRRRRERSAH